MPSRNQVKRPRLSGFTRLGAPPYIFVTPYRSLPYYSGGLFCQAVLSKNICSSYIYMIYIVYTVI